jgi:UDP-N-acetylglucosamine 3-dehydrogenase
MNIGILGTGFGSYHAELLMKSDLIDKVVVFGRNETKLQRLKEQLEVEVTSHIDDIMLNPEIDVIDICLPSNMHRQYAVEAMKSGKHVFCETPVCLTLEDAEAMRYAEKQYGTKILVNQFIKFEPAYSYLHHAIQQQKYGKLLSLSLKRETPPLWGKLGLDSITTNLMIHELDFVTGLLGQPNLLSVWGSETEDKNQAIVRAAFEHQNTFIEVTASSQMPELYPFTVSYEAYFEKAKLVFYERDLNGQVDIALIECTASGQQEIVLEAVNPYSKSIEHAIQCLQNGSESIITLERALQSLRIAIELKQRL